MSRLTSRGNVPNFSIVYAQKVGGYREHLFETASELADHVQSNRPGLFAGAPKLDENYEDKLANICNRGYRLPSDG